MSLRIDELNTTCHVPPQHRHDVEMVDSLAHGRFARDLGEHLGPSLARQPAIVRVQRLSMRVILPASELNEDALSLRWRQEFGKALFTALAYPAGAGPIEVFREESIAAFIGSVICDLLDGTASTKWQYAEFEPFFSRGSTEAALGLICEWPQQSLPVLLHLAEKGALGQVLTRFDDVAMERLFAVLTSSTETETKTLSIGDLITVAKLALEHPPNKVLALRSRAYALNLFVEGQRASRRLSSPRMLFHALLALAVLSNEDVFWPGVPGGESRTSRLPLNVTGILESIARTLADSLSEEMSKARIPFDPMRMDDPQLIYLEVLESIGGVLRAYRKSVLPTDLRQSPRRLSQSKALTDTIAQGRKITLQLEELDQLLQTLRAGLRIPPPSAKPLQVHWISSDWCGLFFLSSTLTRLGWVAAWAQLADFEAGGPGCLLAGLALTISGRFDPAVPFIEPATALFAGYLEEPDLLHARRVFRDSSVEARRRVLQAVLPNDRVDDAAETWERTFDRLAETLLRTFASRVRGFHQATRLEIVRSFIARPGRIRIEPERLVIFPAPSAFNVALHIAGMDQPIDPPVWLDARRIEFQFGDL